MQVRVNDSDARHRFVDELLQSDCVAVETGMLELLVLHIHARHADKA